MMKRELNDLEMTKISGGGAYINTERGLVVFDSFDEVYQLKNCSPYDAQEAMDQLIGKYSTTEEFDQACVDMLRDRGWI